MENRFRYSGEQQDVVTGAYYLRARYYEPQEGRFTQEDTYKGYVEDPSSLNLYTYCMNNPIIYIDPSGHKAMYVDGGGGSTKCGSGSTVERTGNNKKEANIITSPLPGILVGTGAAVKIRSALEVIGGVIIPKIAIPIGIIITADRITAVHTDPGYIDGYEPGVQSATQPESNAEEAGKSNLPNQGTVQGNIEGAPPVDAGKQGKHVPGHPNDIAGKSQWKPGENGVDETQEAWQNGTELPDGTRVWDTGKVVGQDGETGVRVSIDSDGNIHGYPVNPGRYLK